MIAPSPAPIPRKRARWPWIVAAGFVLTLVAGLTAATYPQWAGPMLLQQIESRGGTRLGATVEIAGIELGYDTIRLKNVHIERPGVRLDFEQIDIEADVDLFESGSIRVIDMHVRGGSLLGSRNALEPMIREVLQAGDLDAVPDERGGLGARVSLRPEQLTVDGVVVDLSDGSSRARGTLTLELISSARSMTWAVSRLVFDLDGRQFVANEIGATLTGGPRGLLFPVELSLEGLGTQMTPEIAIAGTTGVVEFFDASATRIRVDVQGGFGDGSHAVTDSPRKLWSVSGTLHRDLSEGKLAVEMDSFELGRVPEVLAALPLVRSEGATVGGRVDLDLRHGRVRVDGNLSLSGLNVRHPLLARSTVDDLGFDLTVAATFDPKALRVELENLELRRGGVVLRVAGEIVHPPTPSERRYDLRFSISTVACQSVLDAIPAQLVPGLGGFRLGGDFEADLHVDVDFSDLDALVLDGDVDLWKCRVRSAPDRLLASRINGEFVHRVRMKDGRQRTLHLRPGSGDFTPIGLISPMIIAAVLTTEDGGFWRHRGFLPTQFRGALRRNLKAGRVRLGASTISMQTVKNVFLSHERTLSRKLQEMFLTWYLEEISSKDRIMELYLNVVEFGPGVYGVTHAAQHYFGRHPWDITSLEAAYLALMLPSPVRRHVYYCKQKLSDRFIVKLRRIHRLMYSRHRISEEEYLLWKNLEVRFDTEDLRGEAECLDEIESMQAAVGIPFAESGVLRGEHEMLDSPNAPIAGRGATGEFMRRNPRPDVDGRAAEAIPRTQALSDNEDPAMSDAPGVPAMDERDESVAQP